MSKVTLGLILGAALGLLDGASTLAYPDPALRERIVTIVVGSTLKGLVTGILVGALVARLRSQALAIALGLGVGLALSFGVAAMEGAYWLDIMLPGAILGAIVGFATQRYGRRRDPAAAETAPRG